MAAAPADSIFQTGPLSADQSAHGSREHREQRGFELPYAGPSTGGKALEDRRVLIVNLEQDNGPAALRTSALKVHLQRRPALQRTYHLSLP